MDLSEEQETMQLPSGWNWTLFTFLQAESPGLLACPASLTEAISGDYTSSAKQLH